MRGKTHWKIGVCTYLISNAVMASNYNITISTLMAAAPYIACGAIGGIFPDIDTETSTISRHTAIIRKVVPLLLMVALMNFLSGDTNLMINLLSGFDIKMLFVALSVVIIPFLKHRGFTHTVEGMIFYCFSFYCVAHKLGYTYLVPAFSIGYFSHIWLADFLTTQGVYTSFIAKCLSGKSAICSVLSSKMSLGLMSTNTDSGNLFEFVYVIALVAVALLLQGVKNFTLL